MAVAHDTASESHTGTTGSASEASFTWTHTPVGTPRGVLVFVFNLSSATDTVSSVTYGGTALTAVTGGRAVDTAGEAGSCKAYLLGASVPTGAQSVVVNRTNNADVMYAVAITVTAAADTEIKGTPVLLQEDGTLAEQSVDAGAGVDATRYAGTHWGGNAVPTAGASSTALHGLALASQAAGTVRETTAGTGARLVGFNMGFADDRAAVHLAIGEVAGGGGGSTQPHRTIAANARALHADDEFWALQLYGLRLARPAATEDAPAPDPRIVQRTVQGAYFDERTVFDYPNAVIVSGPQPGITTTTLRQTTRSSLAAELEEAQATDPRYFGLRAAQPIGGAEASAPPPRLVAFRPAPLLDDELDGVAALFGLRVAQPRGGTAAARPRNTYGGTRLATEIEDAVAAFPLYFGLRVSAPNGGGVFTAGSAYATRMTVTDRTARVSVTTRVTSVTVS